MSKGKLGWFYFTLAVAILTLPSQINRTQMLAKSIDRGSFVYTVTTKNSSYYGDGDGDGHNDNDNDTGNIISGNTAEIQQGSEAQPKPSKSASASFTECMLQLENHFQTFVPPIANASHPFPFSVKIVDNQYYVLLSLATTKNDNLKWEDRRNSYACNGVDGATGVSFNKKTRGVLIVKCPQSLNSADGALLETFSIKPYSNDTESVVYNVEMFLECELKDIAAHADRSGSRSVKTGITAAFSGERDKALEWAMYHHLLGFDHIWIYVNEPWEDGKDLHNTDFLTFIPYNNHAKDIYVGANISTAGMSTRWMEVFREASQNDALYRAHRMGLEWMAFIDLDEVVVLGAPGAHAPSNATVSTLMEGSSSRPLQKYLADFKAKYDHEYGAIFLQSVPFGKNIQETDTELELQIDYTWRQDLNLTSSPCCRARNKLLVNMLKSVGISIHYYESEDRPHKMYYPTADELRVNHYKKKEQGVFNMRHRWLGPPNIIEDTRVRDEYRDLIVQGMASVREER